MMNNRNFEKQPKEINWGQEVLHAFAIAGRVFLKILSGILNVLLTILLIGLITSVIVAGVFAIYIKNNIDPSIDTSLLITTGTDTTTRLYYLDYETEEDRQSRNGTLVELEDERIYASENSLWASYSQFPKYLYQAFIAIEDRRFYTHNGVDWLGTGKAVVNFFVGFEKIRGASTITQQLVKNLTGNDEVRVQRKVQEILQALDLEKQKSKEEILEMYLNIIYFSNNCTGVQAAANYFFDKDVSELDLLECAALAAIVKNPSLYDPVRYPEENAKRRIDVLYAMWENGYITEAEYEENKYKELTLVLSNESSDDSENSTVFSWYKEAVFNDVRDALMEKYGCDSYTASMMIYSGGLKIYTVMDPEVQAIMEEVYENDTEYFPYSNDGLQPQSAMVIVDPYTGDVLGIVGGRGEKTDNRIQNLATGVTRSPGSSIKPLAVYAPALDLGIINFASIYDDVPVTFGDYDEDWDVVETAADGTVVKKTAPAPWPGNLPYVYAGLTTVNQAIITSKNTVAVRVLQDLTIEKSFDFVKNKLGMTSFIDSYTTASGTILTDKGLASLALGQMNFGVTVEEITAAYSIFQNNGVYNKPRTFLYVYDSNDNLILENKSEEKIVISDQTASIMTIMMENVMNQGTGTSVTLRKTVDVAGKTGTAGNDFDRWFVGYTPYYVGGVWFGYEMNQTLSDFRQNPSCLVWDIVMTKLHQKYIDEANAGGTPLKTFTPSAGVIECEYCLDSGELATEACRLDPRGNRIAKGYFTRDNMPDEPCDTHVVVKYDSVVGGVVLDIGKYTGNLTDLTDTALIRVESRSFPIQITVTDAQYVYRDLPANVVPGGWWGEPFFQNALPKGVFAGITNTWSLYNRFCYDYFDFEAFYREHPEARPEPEGTNDPDDTGDPDETDTGAVDENDIYGDED
ncbi:MAG: transglycosylase domain-containing protein [Clostridia bacterium]|nr:transglycosylase domain-containing protein [Clostridia bacterium]